MWSCKAWQLLPWHGNEQGQTPSVCSRHFFLGRPRSERRHHIPEPKWVLSVRADTTSIGASCFGRALGSGRHCIALGVNEHEKSIPDHTAWWGSCWSLGAGTWTAGQRGTGDDAVTRGAAPVQCAGMGTRDQQQLCFCLSRAYSGKLNKHIIKEGETQKWFFHCFSSVYFRKCCPHRWGWQQQLSLAVVADSKLPGMIFLQWKQS